MRGVSRSFIALSCGLTLVTSGCGNFVRHGTKPNAGSTKRFTYGSGETFPRGPSPLETSGAQPSATTGILRVQVLDNHNAPLAGAFVRYRGPVKGQKATDAHGNINVTLKPGNYEIDIAPCGTTIITESAVAASATVTAGTKTPLGVMNGVRWRPRFKPENSAHLSRAPPWKIGQVVTVALRVQDGCTFEPAKKLAVPTFAWRVSNNYAITRSPVYETDAGGYAPVTVRCAKQGDGMIELYDRNAPDDNADVILSASSPPPGHSWCEN